LLRSKAVGELIRSRGAAILAVVAVGACIVGLVVFAVRWHGFPVQREDLNDGGVWVTNSQQGLLGREDTPVKQLNLELQSSGHVGDRLDVLQNGEAVIAVDDDASEVTPVDPSLGIANPHDAIPLKDAAVTLGGDVVALTDTAGQVWATHVDTAGGGTPLNALSSAAKPLVKDVGADARLTVSESGNIYAASATTDTLTRIANVGGGFADPVTQKLTPVPNGTIGQMTAVGGQAVWLDSTGRLGVAGHVVDVGQGAVLQQVGPAAAAVLVETPTKLLSVNMKTAATKTLASVAGTTASAPVRLGGCDWGLWAGGLSAYVVEKCGAKLTTVAPFTVPADAALVFRVNRGSIFVNDLISGDVWAVSGATVQAAANWQSLAPKRQQHQKQVQLQKSSRQSPPKAVTDDLGARSGDATVLHVLDNDRAPSGAILSISAVENDNKNISVQISPDRQTLVAQVDQGVGDQKLVFHYTIDDGERANATATGEVDLSVHAGDPRHGQPQLMYGYTASSPTVYPVADGQSVNIPALTIWRDPAYGDPIDLVTGSAKASAGSASITPAGEIQYVAPTNFRGAVTIRYKVTTGGTANHRVAHVRVYSGLSTAPATAEPDVASGIVGSPISVRPLANDIPGADPVDSNAKLTLAAPVAPQAGLDLSTGTSSGVVTITGKRPGTYILPYRVAYGTATSSSSSDIKVIVQPANQVSNVPIAMPYTATLHGAAPMTIDVLANDYDPRGRLLVAQDAAPQSDTGQLNVAVIRQFNADRQPGARDPVRRGRASSRTRHRHGPRWLQRGHPSARQRFDAVWRPSRAGRQSERHPRHPATLKRPGSRLPGRQRHPLRRARQHHRAHRRHIRLWGREHRRSGRPANQRQGHCAHHPATQPALPPRPGANSRRARRTRHRGRRHHARATACGPGPGRRPGHDHSNRRPQPAGQRAAPGTGDRLRRGHRHLPGLRRADGRRRVHIHRNRSLWPIHTGDRADHDRPTRRRPGARSGRRHGDRRSQPNPRSGRACQRHLPARNDTSD
jgi:hypothetical protein